MCSLYYVLQFHAAALASQLLRIRMANDGSKLRLWCSAFACALAFLGADGFFVDITYVDSAVAKGAGQGHQCCY